jgi:zinc protease
VARGAAGDPANQSGLASLTAELMAEATKQKSHWVLAEATESLGSTLFGNSNRDFVQLTLDTLPEDVNEGIALLAESLTEPAFEEADFQRIKKQRLDELRAERQNPSRLASLIGLRYLLGAELGNPVSGCPLSVSNLKLSDVKSWHLNTVQPESTALFVIGPVNAKDVERDVIQNLGRWKSKKRTKTFHLDVPKPPKKKTFLLLNRPDSVQSALFVAQQFPKRTRDGYVAREHLDNILGGLFTSRINQNLRETHAYTYGARTSVIATKNFGLFTCSTSVETDVTVPALVEVFNELALIRGTTAQSPILAEEMARSRAALVQSLGAHLENNHRLLSDLEELFVYDLPKDYYGNYVQEAVQTTALEVAKETERFNFDQFVGVVVGDVERLKPELEKSGFNVSLAPNDCIDDSP